MSATSAIHCDRFINSGSYVYKNHFYRHMVGTCRCHKHISLICLKKCILSTYRRDMPMAYLAVNNWLCAQSVSDAFRVDLKADGYGCNITGTT